MSNTIVNTQEWIIGMDPEDQGEYMVTFLAEYEIGGEKKSFRGLDIIEWLVDDGQRTRYNARYDYWEDYIDWEAKGDGEWCIDEIRDRFKSSTIKIVAWMPLPEVCED